MEVASTTAMSQMEVSHVPAMMATSSTVMGMHVMVIATATKSDTKWELHKY